jgi:hypothetical protein
MRHSVRKIVGHILKYGYAESINVNARSVILVIGLLLLAGCSARHEQPTQTDDLGQAQAAKLAHLHPFLNDTDNTTSSSQNNTSSPPPEPSQVRINHVETGSDEYVEIVNFGSRSVDMSGWAIVGKRHHEEFDFPALVMTPQGYARVHTLGGQSTDADLYWGRDASIWSTGGQTVLLENAGLVVDSYAVS